MTDWADGIETRNYGIKIKIDSKMLSELIRTIIALGMVAGALFFYLWVRSQIINTGYENQRLFDLEESMLRAQKRLILEEETLRSPERIDTIARNDLEMTPLHPNQLILPKPQEMDLGSLNTMAMAHSETMNAERAASMRVSGLTPTD